MNKVLFFAYGVIFVFIAGACSNLIKIGLEIKDNCWNNRHKQYSFLDKTKVVSGFYKNCELQIVNQDMCSVAGNLSCERFYENYSETTSLSSITIPKANLE